MRAIDTSNGPIVGESRGNSCRFLGIRYAKAPVGIRRFAAPEPPEGHDGSFTATAFGASAMQGQSETPGMAADGALSEDCLFLNVFTPDHSAGRRPVLFWIHGGGFTLGGSNAAIYDGGRLAQRGDVVVVTINYRLGALGYALVDFLSDNAAANPAQLDMIRALEWVRDNIEGFGGDPGNVTLFGQSAGSSAVGTLFAMPDARGLFHKAIMQSGAPANTLTPDAAHDHAHELLEALRLPASKPGALWQLPAAKIIEAQLRLGSGRWRPVAGVENLPLDPMAAIEAGTAANIPLLIGTNRDEIRQFTRIAAPNPEPIDDETLSQTLRNHVPTTHHNRLAAICEVYRGSRSSLGLPAENTDLVDAIRTDVQFRMPAITFAERHCQHQAATYMYLFDWESPAKRGALGACHSLEMPFVFGTLDAPMQDRFCGTSPSAARLRDLMMDSWIAFARSASPEHDAIGAWPRYCAERRSTMTLNADPHVADAPLDDERAAWGNQSQINP